MSFDPVLEDFDALLRRHANELLMISPCRRATVADIDGLARGISTTITESGIPPGRLLGLAAANGPAFLAGLVALRRHRCPVLMLDWRSPETEKQRICRNLGAIGVVRCPNAWPESSAEVIFEPTTSDSTSPVELPSEIGMVLLTSGSTGMPQGILKTMEAFAADDEALTRTMGLQPAERTLASIPLSHAYGLSSVALPALRRGMLLIVPDASNPLDALRAARDSEVTFLPTVPAYLQAVLRMSSPPPLPDCLRLVITAGAPLPPATATRFREAYGRPVHVFYGASEVGGICYDREGGAGERGTLGTPVEGVRIKLEPVDGMTEDRGVVTVRSPATGLGYFPTPKLSSLDNGVFRSSDLATFCNGELKLLGRIDNMINVRGKKVDPAEVERILGRLDGVDEAVVFGVPLPEEGCEMVRAVIAGNVDTLSSEQVRAHCHGLLAGHKVPRSIILVTEIPRTARGKIDRKALHQLSPESYG
jgi:long-chain acyl-CoA synthetase